MLATAQRTKSDAELLAMLPATEREAILSAYTEERLERLRYDWSFWARPKQLPPEGDWFGWLILAGRGFGKTRTGSEWILQRVADGYKRIALVGQTKADVRDTMIEVEESSILKVAPPWLMPVYEPSKRRLTWPQTGAVATAFSGDEPDQLRGPQHDTAWIDEPAKFKYPDDTIDNLEMGLRLGTDPRMICTTTPRPIPVIKKWVKDPAFRVTTGSTYENIANLAPTFIKRMKEKYEGTRLGRQEIYAEILDDDPNALWNREMLEASRVTQHPDLHMITVNVDPHASTGTTGIVVTGVAYQDGVLHGYTLDDVSSAEGAKPNEWGTAVVAAYHKWKADLIVGEVNNGGDMIENVIRNVQGGRNVAYKAVRATRGKHTRAQPISALFEQGRWHMVGMYAMLEDELCSWVPGEDSPNRLDAMVWGGYAMGIADGEEFKVW